MPHPVSSIPERRDILKVGSFSDALFDVISSFLTSDTGCFVTEFEEVTLSSKSRNAFKTKPAGLAQAGPTGFLAFMCIDAEKNGEVLSFFVVTAPSRRNMICRIVTKHVQE